MSWVFGPGSGGTPGGANGDIQFNSSGSFSGSALLTTDGAGSLSASTHVSASTYYGDGSNLTGVTASAVQVADGPQYSLQFRFDSPVSGDLSGSSDLLWDPATSDVLISGNVRLEDGKEFYGDIEGAVRFPARVDEVGGITKGQVVYINGISGQTPTVGLAACDDASKMPAFGLAGETAANNNDLQIVTFGSIKDLDLTSLYDQTFAVGDTLYVQTGSGGNAGKLTNVAPTGSGNLLQNMGKVVRNGIGGDAQIKVGGAGRTNATPNLDKGYIFVGNETDQAIQDSTIFVSASANRVGINNTSPDHTLTVGGDISGSGNISGSGLYVEDAYVSSVPADRVLVSTTNGQITSHSSFTFTSDVLAVPTITASVGVMVTSSTNGSINIGEGISYVFDGVNRLDVLENEFRINKTNFYQGVSGEQTSNFNIRDAQVFLVDTNSSVVTGTLPGVNSSDDYGITFIIKDSGGNAGTNDIVIEPSGSQNIDGGTAAKIATNYGAMTVVAISSSTNGLGWAIVSAT